MTSPDQFLDLILKVAVVFRVMVVVPMELTIFGLIFVSSFHGVGPSQETLLPDLEKDLGVRCVQRERRGPCEQ